MRSAEAETGLGNPPSTCLSYSECDPEVGYSGLPFTT